MRMRLLMSQCWKTLRCLVPLSVPLAHVRSNLGFHVIVTPPVPSGTVQRVLRAPARLQQVGVATLPDEPRGRRLEQPKQRATRHQQVQLQGQKITLAFHLHQYGTHRSLSPPSCRISVTSTQALFRTVLGKLSV